MITIKNIWKTVQEVLHKSTQKDEAKKSISNESHKSKCYVSP